MNRIYSKGILFLALTLGIVLSSMAQTWDGPNVPEPMVEGQPVNGTKKTEKWNFYDTQKSFDEYWKTHTPGRGKGYNVFRRWAAYMEPMVYPSGYMPDLEASDASYKSWKEEQMLPKPGEQGGGAAQSANWQLDGPINNAQTLASWYPNSNWGQGRVNFMEWHPTNSNLVYVGTAAGGLWKSLNGGSTWVLETSFLETNGVSDLAISPSNPDIMYLASGDCNSGKFSPTKGVFKSVDGGASWQTTGFTRSLSDESVIHEILVHPTNPNFVIIATSGGGPEVSGLWHTNDGGANWNRSTWDGGFYGCNWRDLEFKPGDPSVVYAAQNDCSPSAVYKSTDGGLTFPTKFVPSTSGARRLEIAVTQDNPNAVYVLAGKSSDNGFYGLYKSTNSGNSYSLRSSSPNILGYALDGSSSGGQAWYVISLAVSPTDENEIYVGGVNIWKSTNGGSSWGSLTFWNSFSNENKPVVHADIHALEYAPNGDIWSGNDGGIHRSADDGATWTHLDDGFSTMMFERVSVTEEDPEVMVVGAQDNSSFKRDATGWYGIGSTGDGHDNMINHQNKDIIYTATQNGNLRKTVNGGLNYGGTISPRSDGAWITPFTMHLQDPDILFAGYHQVYKSTDGGDNWSTISGSLAGGDDFIALAIDNTADYIYAATGTRIFVTSNGGGSWTERTNGLPVAQAKISSVEVSRSNGNVAWVTFNGYAAGEKVYKTTNGGVSWTNISGSIPNIPIHCIILDVNSTDETVFIGGEHAVFTKTSTIDWTVFDNGMPDVPVTDLEIQYGAGKLVAATRGRGIWTTDINTTPSAPTIGDCAIAGEEIVDHYSTPFTNNNGHLVGHDSWNATEYAEFVQAGQGYTHVMGVDVRLKFADANNTATAMLTFNMMDDNGPNGAPGTVLATTSVPYSSLGTGVGVKNEVFFDSPVSVNGDYYVGIEFDYGDGKNIVVYNGGSGATPNSLWIGTNSVWQDSPDWWGNATRTYKSAIYAVTGTIPTTDFSAAPTTVGAGGTIQFSNQSTNSGGAIWTLNGGTPVSSFALNPQVAFNTPGTYDIKLVSYGTCGGKDSLTKANYITIGAPTLSTGVTDVSCNGGSDGAIDLDPGEGTFTYLWSNGATTQDISGLTAGDYTCTVTSGGSSSDVTATVNEPGAIQLSDSKDDVSCNGGNDGSIDLTVQGGTAPYSYAWSNGATVQDLSNLTAGSYSVTVTAQGGCSANTSIQISQPSTVSVTVDGTTDATCGSSNGAIDISVSGGDGSYSYAWSNGSTSEDPSGLAAGTYSVTVTDGNGCTGQTNATISQPSALDVDVASVTDVSCNGGNDGEVDINPSGGSQPYTYSWSNGASSEDVSGLAAGAYTVTVTDASSCSYVANMNVGQPAAMAVGVNSITHINCNGNANGAITINVSGGSSPYSYAWTSGATSKNVSGLSAGSYSVTVTDAEGCTGNTNGQVTEPTALTTSVKEVTMTSCAGGNDGEIDINVAGGSPAYSYAWSNGATTQDVSGLSPGTYNVTITDNKGCSSVENANVGQPAALTGTIAGKVDPTCVGATDGSLDLSVSGGTTPYSYAWSNGATIQDPSGLGRGGYSVTITDANGCSAVTVGNMTDPDSLLVEVISQSNVSCAGGNDGSVTIDVEGGIPPYNFSWSTGSALQNPSGLSAGTHTVTVSAPAGCESQAQVTITEPAGITVSLDSKADISCNGGNDGEIDISVSGGTAPYSYVWSTNATTEDVTGLNAGNYSVTVSSAGGGCSAVFNESLSQPSAVSVSIDNVVDATCGASNGSVDISVSGGTPSYTYAWSDGSTNEDLSTVGAGNYSVTVTDDNGCTDNAQASVDQPSALSVTIGSVTDVKCNGGSDGAIDINVSGGSGSPAFVWSNGPSSEDVSGLAAGTYEVTVTDQALCSFSISATVGEPAALAGSIVTQQDVTCNGGSNGTVDLAVSGGVAPYSYSWNGGSNLQDPTGLSEGLAEVTITDANLCQTTASTTISEPAAISIVTTALTDASCQSGNDGSIDITVSGGSAPYTYSWNNGATIEDLTALSAGSYSVTASDDAGCSSTMGFVVGQPAAISISVDNVLNANCNFDGGGSVDITASGGTAPYSYLWSNGVITEDAVNLGEGSYTVTVTDDLGCTGQVQAAVSKPEAANVEITNVKNISCAGGSDGSIDITVTGGIPPYQYGWTGGATTQDVSSLAVGLYTVTVSSGGGCNQAINIDITEPTMLSITNDDQTNILCNGLTTGAIDISATGGNMPYTYSWSNGASTEDIQNLPAGQYIVTLTDVKNCEAKDTINITQPTAVVASIDAQTNVTCGSADGTIDASASGGDGSYTYSWSNGETTQNLTSLSAGLYVLTVSDGNGCSDSASTTITQPSTLSATISQTDVSCNGSTDGAVDLTPTGGTAPYTFAWSNGATTEDLNGLVAGNYQVTVSDDAGCTFNASANLVDPAVITVNVAVVQDASCNGGNDGSIDLHVSGGTAPYTYAWNNGSSDEDPTGLTAGQYTVNITDDNGCASSGSATVGEPDLMTASVLSQTDINCNGGNNGAIDLQVSGGTQPYSYSWTNGASTEDQSGLGAGTYNVTVTSAGGCTADASAVLAEPAALTLGVKSVIGVACNGGNNGEIDIDVAGGSAPYTYAWGSGQTTQDIAGLTSGQYDLTVTDVNACTAQISANVTQSGSLAISVDASSDVTCFGGNDGSADISVSGGSAPYTYAWSGGATTQNVSSLVAGNQNLTVTDSLGCSSMAQVVIGQPDELTLSSGNVVNVSCEGGSTGSAGVLVSGGTTPYSYAWTSGGDAQNVFGLAAGSETVTVTDANGCNDQLAIAVTEPSALVASITGTVDNSGCGAGDGSIDLDVSGGSSPYTYAWSDGSTNEDVSGLDAGTYSVIVTDNNGCKDTIDATINQPGTLSTVVDSVWDASCNSNTDGAIFITATGGTGGLDYLWSNGPATEDVTGLASGTYTVTVSDQASCSVNLAVTVNQPDPLSLIVNATMPTCNGGTDGELDLVVNGGTSPFTYMWGAGETTEDLTGLSSGNFSIAVTDDNGCNANVNTVLDEPGAFSVSVIHTTDASCNGSADGSANITVNGGNAPYTYAWSNASSDEDPTGLAQGGYTVAVTDDEGCVANGSITVGEPVALSIGSSVIDVTTNGGDDAAIDVTVTGGSSPYAYQWSTGASTEDVQDLVAGDYTVWVTDSKLCKDSSTITVNQPGAVSYCSGVTTLTAATGTFDDGSGNNLYATNTDCQWLIQPANTQYIILSFQKFATELDADYITVYDGADTTAPIIDWVSGINTPFPVASSGPEMLVRFTTNASINDSGWVADYEAIANPTSFCQGTDTLIAASGTFADGSDASDYNENSGCGWLIQPAGATSVTVGFTSMDTEDGFDWVRVYDGNDETAPLLGEFTGSQIDSVTSSGGSVFVHFTSDFSVNAGGWDAYYNSSTETNNFCVGTDTLTGKTGSFGDGSGSSNYGPNSDCFWLIQPAGVATITLDFSNFDVEFFNDYVEVYDGDNTGATLIGLETGDSTSGPITSTGGSMLVRFVSNNTNQGPGWFASYTTTDPVQGAYCGGTTNLTTATGSFDDGSGPNDDYVEDSDCRWLIQPAGATSITLSFTEFATESNYDMIHVYDGIDENGTLVATYSGSGLPAPATIVGGSMYVVFTSDGSVNSGGWIADYTSSTGTPSYCSGTATLTAPSGTFNDGSGPNDYLGDADCYWLIQPLLADSIGLEFTAFDTEDGFDSVYVYDGDNVGAPLLGEYTGSTLPTEILVSSGGSMLVHFVSNSSNNAAGWTANYEAAVSSNAFCAGQTDLTAVSGTFSDGSGSADYAESSNCSWLIAPSAGSFIELNFSDLDLEAGYDFVTVYDGADDNASVLASLTGSDVPATIVSSGNMLYVVFASDYAVNAGGWSATYDTTSVQGTGGPCSGVDVLTALSDTISDGSGPANYLNNAHCEWLIQPAGASTVRLTFTEFATESGYDFVNVYDGADTNAALLGSFSGASLPSQVFSTGGSMLVRFTSDNLFDDQGFVAYYDTASSTGGGGPTPTPCNGYTVMIAQSDTIGDGSGPSAPYVNGSSCEWLIQPAGADSITLSFLDFATEDDYDFVGVFDGPDTNAALLGAFTGATLPASVTSSGGVMYVWFVADGSVNDAGWSAVYNAHNSGGCTLAASVVGTNATCEGCSDGTATVTVVGETGNTSISWSSGGSSLVETGLSAGWVVVTVTDDALCTAMDSVEITEPVPVPCSGLTVLTTPSGNISDGSGSADYLENSNCQWLIQPANADAITLTFNSFTTEQDWDSVLVYDGADENAPLLGAYTGATLPPVLTSTGGSLYVRFVADGLFNEAGWDASYTSVIIGVDDFAGEMVSVSIAPNPSHGDFTFHLELEHDAKYEAKLYDALGVEVWHDPGQSIGRDFSKDVNVTGLPSGMYNLHLRINGMNHVYKVIIER